MTRVEARDLLLHVMADLSEEHYCASWLYDLEKSLQAVLDGGPTEYFGMAPLEIHDFMLLKRLRHIAKGWWTWDESGTHCVKFVPDPGTEEPGIEVTSDDW